MDYTWKNVVATQVWKCKICGEIPDRESIASHLLTKHKPIKGVEMFNSKVYSDIEYPFTECEGVV